MVPFYASYFSVCANQQKIQSLPKDVRDQIMSVSGAAGLEVLGQELLRQRRGRRDGAGQGRQLSSSTATMCRPTKLARWNKVAGEPLWEEWVKKMEGKGHKEARDILNAALEFAKN